MFLDCTYSVSSPFYHDRISTHITQLNFYRYGIDTREITKKIREKGSMLGKIIVNNEDVDFRNINHENLVSKVSTKEVTTYNPNGELHIVAVDCGMKANIIRCLVERGAKVTVVPYDHDFRSMEYDGLFLSNGPGDPAMCDATVTHIKDALKGNKPIFGICLGMQLLARAAGFDTYVVLSFYLFI